MAVPKRRSSKTSKLKRRMHDKLLHPVIVACKGCGAKIAPHRVCPDCGSYKEKKYQ